MIALLLTRHTRGIVLGLILIFVMAGDIIGQGRYGVMLPRGSFICTSSLSGDLYSGIDNYLLLKADTLLSFDRIYIYSTNGHAVFDTLNRFLAIPEKPGKVRYTLYGLEGADTLLLGYRFFNVRRVPDPQLKVDDTIIPVRGQIDKSLLLYCDSLSVFITEDIPGSESWMSVKDFTLGYNYGGFHVSYLNPSGKMLLETREILSTLGPDREISIKATVETNSNITRELPIYRLMIY